MQKSLVKALQILEFISSSQKECGVTEISSSLNLYKSNVHEILTTFESFGYVKKDPLTRKYSLSLKFLQIAHTISDRFNFHEIVHAKLTEACEKIGEVVYLGIPDGHNVMYLDGSFPKNNISTRPVIGMTAPLTCAGIGKAMLAYMPVNKILNILETDLKAYTENSIVDKDKMLHELELIRQRGFSVDNMEHEYGIKCVAVPVFNLKGNLLGALSVTGPSLRFPRSVYSSYAKILTETSKTIGSLLNI